MLKKSKSPIGMDISDSGIKVIQLVKKGGKIRVQAIGQISYDDECIINGEITNENCFLSSLKKIYALPQFGAFSTNEAVICLPEPKTFIQLIKIDRQADRDTAIRSEIEKHIPLNINELNYDAFMVSFDDYFEYVLVAAAPTKLIDQYVSLIEKSGIYPIALEIESVAISRSLLAEEISYIPNPKSNYAIIDFGSSRSNMFVYSGNSILFSMSIPFSGNMITDTIAEKLEISKIQAEKAKIICGLDSSKAQGVVKKILDEQISELIKKTKEVVNYYNDFYSDRGPLSKIIITGGGSNVKNIDKLLTDEILIESTIGNCLSHLTDSETIISSLSSSPKNSKSENKKTISTEHGKKYIPIDSPAIYATAIGLALRNLFIDD